MPDPNASEDTQALLQSEQGAVGNNYGSLLASDQNECKEQTPKTSILMLPWRKLLLLCMLATVTMCTSMVQSCIVPFFPKVATPKGLSQSHVGMVFGCFSLSCFLYTPFSAALLSRFGAKRWLVFSTAVYASTAVCFGLASLIDSAGWFFATSIVCRCAESVGSIGADTAALCICARCLPDHVNFATSVVVSAFGIGFTVGPPLGGILYECVGYIGTFAVLGATIMLAAILAAALVERGSADTNAPAAGHMFALLKRKHFTFLFAFGTIALGVPHGIYRPTLEIHLRPYNLSPTEVGLMYMIIQIQFTIWSPIAGMLADKYKCPQLLVIFGQCLCAVAFMLFGPSPLLPISDSLWLNAVAFTLCGAGMAPVWSLMCGVWLDMAKYYRIDVAKTDVSGAVSTAMMAMLHLG